MHANQIQSRESSNKVILSIVLPTYNEAKNILKLIEAIRHNIPSNVLGEIIVVDGNSPDGTGRIVEDYANNIDTLHDNDHQQNNSSRSIVKVVHQENRNGLISAILQGVNVAKGENILVMDADFSHPPEIIPRMLGSLLDSDCDLVIASRHVKGGSVVGWPIKRRIISNGANKIARHSLKIGDIKDPISGFFAFKRKVIERITFDTSGYKILLEILVKASNINVKEIPYTFINRQQGESKLDSKVIFDYIKAIWRLYRYGQKSRRAKLIKEKRKPILFFSKAARFYTVGASGFLVNYLISLLLSNGVLSNFFYMHATTIGIICSITSNFVLNKAWTFEQRDFSFKRTIRQYGLYLGFSGIGAVVQLSLLYLFVQSYDIQYLLSLLLAVAIASAGNFLLNKKWVFGEKIWG